MTQSSTPSITSSTQEKQPCGLNISQAPVINGLKLGMTTEGVLALFPGSKDDPELRASLAKPPSQFGISSFLIRPSKYENKVKFVEISQITLTLLDGRVYKLYLSYNGREWPHVDQFVTMFVEGTSLPAADQWQAYVGMDDKLKILRCFDFEIRVFAGGPGGNVNYVQMQDLEAEKKLKERRAKARATATPSPEKQ